MNISSHVCSHVVPQRDAVRLYSGCFCYKFNSSYSEVRRSGVEVNRHAQLDTHSHTETVWAGIHPTLGCHDSILLNVCLHCAI